MVKKKDEAEKKVREWGRHHRNRPRNRPSKKARAGSRRRQRNRDYYLRRKEERSKDRRIKSKA